MELLLNSLGKVVGEVFPERVKFRKIVNLNFNLFEKKGVEKLFFKNFVKKLVKINLCLIDNVFSFLTFFHFKNFLHKNFFLIIPWFTLEMKRD